MDCRVHKLVADLAFLSKGHVLLVKYRDTRNYDGQAGWFLPDDFLAHLEHPTDAAARIARQQLGISRTGGHLSHIESFGNGAWHLVFHFVASTELPPTLRLSENVRAADWFPLDALPDASEVAHGGWAIDVLKRINSSP